MDWGHARIDPLNYESFIESSPMDRWLYEDCGYRRVMTLHIDLEKRNPSECWKRMADKCPPPPIPLLWRPPRGIWDARVPEGPWAVNERTWMG